MTGYDANGSPVEDDAVTPLDKALRACHIRTRGGAQVFAASVGSPRHLFKLAFLAETERVRGKIGTARLEGREPTGEEIEGWRTRARIALKLCREAELGFHRWVFHLSDATRCLDAHHSVAIVSRDLERRKGERTERARRAEKWAGDDCRHCDGEGEVTHYDERTEQEVTRTCSPCHGRGIDPDHYL